jgi:hypothetical protein
VCLKFGVSKSRQAVVIFPAPCDSPWNSRFRFKLPSVEVRTDTPASLFKVGMKVVEPRAFNTHARRWNTVRHE